MKITFSCSVMLVLLMFTFTAYSQNVGIATNTPTEKLTINGSLLITLPAIKSKAEPDANHIAVLVTGVTDTFLIVSDSVHGLLDQGGASNYPPNSVAGVTVVDTVGINDPDPRGACEITFDMIDLGEGDSLYILTNNDEILLIGGSNINGTHPIFTGNLLKIFLVSNADASVGAGFSASIRKLFPPPANPEAVADNYGNTVLYYNALNGSLKVGANNSSSLGIGSIEMGSNCNASGINSIALGQYSIARGRNSIAIGSKDATVDGENSIALGMNARSQPGSFGSIAIGHGASVNGDRCISLGNVSTYGTNTFAMGNEASAANQKSFAIGNNVSATGASSTAMGNYVTTNNFNGAFIIGDNSTTTVMQTSVENDFRARFAGGYRLFTNSVASIGAILNANANSWSTISDVRLKEKFLPVNGEAFLKEIADMNLPTWNYKGQDAKTLRHYGPMAQDFYAAFGKDDIGVIGCDTLINQQDFLGVNLIAIQALIKRTITLKDDNAQLQIKNKELEIANARMEQQLEVIQGKMDNQNDALSKRMQQLELLVQNQQATSALAIGK